MLRGRPWVRMKIAASLDGRTALANGTSQWITGEAARADGHAWRKRAGAVLTGIGTVLDDDPRLDVRLVETVQPLRVVVDSRLQTPVQRAHPAAAGPGADRRSRRSGRCCCCHAASRRCRSRALRLCRRRCRVDLAGLLDKLGQREINELHVEAGARLNGALLEGPGR